MRKSHKEYLKYCLARANANSKDPSTKTAAIIVNYAGDITAIGYNRFSKGVLDAQISTGIDPKRYNAADKITWNKDGEWIDTKYPYVVHAEVACCLDWLKNNDRGYVPADNDIMYMTLAPCVDCVKMIIETGIKHIIFADDKYHDKDFSIAARRLMDACGVKYEHIPLEE